MGRHALSLRAALLASPTFDFAWPQWPWSVASSASSTGSASRHRGAPPHAPERGAAPPATVLAAALAAATLPTLLAYNVSPSPTFLNQALALALWAGFVWVAAPVLAPRRAALLLAALAGVAVSVPWAMAARGLPASLGLSALGLLAAAALLALAGAGAQRQRDALFAAFAWGWLLCGLLNLAVGVVQVFWPELPDGHWLARSSLAGRAVGNLRQPNHLSSLLLWACIAALALAQMGRLPRRAAWAAMAALVFGVVLTASRTGLVGVALLAAWGLLDRRLSRANRLLLLATPLLYALAWYTMAQWAAAAAQTFGGQARMAEGDLSSSRFAIWSNTLALIRAHPWSGVGFGEFNLAWTLSAFPDRPTAFFDHTHNLPLQLAVELGLPLATAVLALLLAALWAAARRAWSAQGGTAERAAVLMLAMIGLHSLLEYPLWYAYFLLPAAWAWGFALGGGDANADEADGDAAQAPPSAVLRTGAVLLLLGATASVVDYGRVTTIFAATPGAPPLEQRIAEGRRSWFFAHHADYALVTSGVAVDDPTRAFDRAVHYLLDTRLTMAWARALARQGELDRARHLADRLREFRKPDNTEFFAACAPAEGAAAAPRAASDALPPFPCEPLVPPLDWQDFLPNGR